MKKLLAILTVVSFLVMAFAMGHGGNVFAADDRPDPNGAVGWASDFRQTNWENWIVDTHVGGNRSNFSFVSVMKQPANITADGLGATLQSSFAVPHDIDGLAALYGGSDKLIEKLDALFSAQPKYNVGSYGFVIHEMAEMAQVDFGQCAISNQPSFHIPYLYAALGKPEKTNYWVKRICRELFSFKDNGFPGDEDNGTMAAWYIFSCLGFYPLCPGKPEYIRSNMLVKSAEINGRRWNSFDFGPVIKHEEIEKALEI